MMGGVNRGIYLVVTPFFPSEGNWRGPFIYDQVRALERTGKQVVVFVPSNRVGHYYYEGIKVNLFPALEMPSYFFLGFMNGINRRNFIKAFYQLGYDPRMISVAHCHTGPFGIYGLALRRLNPDVKVFVQHHDRDPFTIRNGHLAGFWPNLWFRAMNSFRIFNQIDLHICISEGVKDNLLSFPKAGEHEAYSPYAKRLRQARFVKKARDWKTKILYNGVDTSKFFREDKKHEGFVIGCIANFVPLKDYLTLLRAFDLVRKRGIRDVRLILVGSGPMESACQQFVVENKLDDIVEFRSEVRHEQLRGFYNSIDLFVLPSLFEGFGCVCTEAAASGVPFMITEHQGAAEVISPEERHLWTFPPRDHQRLAELILDYYHNRTKQTYCVSLSIDELISEFLSKIEALKSGR